MFGIKLRSFVNFLSFAGMIIKLKTTSLALTRVPKGGGKGGGRRPGHISVTPILFYILASELVSDKELLQVEGYLGHNDTLTQNLLGSG